jgi:hypothetical protein
MLLEQLGKKQKHYNNDPLTTTTEGGGLGFIHAFRIFGRGEE